MHGIFLSKLSYCIQLYGNIWGLKTLEDSETRQNSFTKANLKTLQVIQNKVLRLMTGRRYDTPVLQLLIVRQSNGCPQYS